MTRTRGTESIYTNEKKLEMSKIFKEGNVSRTRRCKRYFEDASVLLDSYDNDGQSLFKKFKETLSPWAAFFPEKERLIPKLCLLVIKFMIDSKSFPCCAADIIQHQKKDESLIDDFPKLKELFQLDNIDMSIFEERVTATAACTFVEKVNTHPRSIKPAVVALLGLYHLCECEMYGKQDEDADFFEKYDLYKK